MKKDELENNLNCIRGQVQNIFNNHAEVFWTKEQEPLRQVM